MDGVNGAGTPYRTTLRAPQAVAQTAQSNAGNGPIPAIEGQATVGISSLAHMLSDAAARAAQRDASTSRNERVAIGDRATQAIQSPVYEQSKQMRDAQVPDSDDPQRLKQARQATASLNGKGENPFKGLSLEQLTLIEYDESGAFTLNERRAARVASQQAQSDWSRDVSNQLMQEYNRDGHFSPKTLQGILDDYKNLPPILEARLGDDYEANLNMHIKSAQLEAYQHRDPSQSAEGKGRLPTLLDLLFAQLRRDMQAAAETEAKATVQQ